MTINAKVSTKKSFGSTGGTDILSVALLKRFSVRLGNTTLALNCMVLLVGTLEVMGQRIGNQPSW